MTDRDTEATRLGCPNRFCDYQGDPAATGYCPRCCLTPAEAEAMAGAGSNTPCYCSDPRDEHARGVGACLMVRDGVRCGCSRFENPATGGTTVPVHLLPLDDVTEGPAWLWPNDDPADEALPGDDPDLPRPTTATGPVGLDDVITELREGLGTGIRRPDGALYPGHLQEIEESLMRVEHLLRDLTRPSLLLLAARCAVVFVTLAALMLLGWLIVGASTIAGVIP